MHKLRNAKLRNAKAKKCIINAKAKKCIRRAKLGGVKLRSAKAKCVESLS